MPNFDISLIQFVCSLSHLMYINILINCADSTVGIAVDYGL